MLDVPSGSIYFWMYNQGLKHVPLAKVLNEVRRAGKQVRDKDAENYWNGWYRSDLYHGSGADDVFMLTRDSWRGKPKAPDYFSLSYNDYPLHPYLQYPEIQNRWVPCNKDNKPVIKWGNGCLSLADAKACSNQVYLAENVKGCKFIVIDCDGDHDDKLDMQTVAFLHRYTTMTHAMFKPKLVNQYEGYEDTGCTVAASFHLTFKVDCLVPTMHFPYAHVDIIGNRCNSLRYLKNKEWNGLQPAAMTQETWDEIKKYIAYRKEKDDARRNELARFPERAGGEVADEGGVR